MLTAESQAGGRALGCTDPSPVGEPASQGTKTGNEKSKQRASKQINKGRTAEKRRMTTRCLGEHIICVLNLMSSPHAGSLQLPKLAQLRGRREQKSLQHETSAFKHLSAHARPVTDGVITL